MSDSTDLRRIVGAMTERPWEIPDHDDPVARITDLKPGDVRAIVTLANHADALVALVEAVEAWRHTRASDTRALMAEVRAVDAALSAVHAIPENP